MGPQDGLPFQRARSAEQRQDRLARLTDTTRGLLEQTRAAMVTLAQIGAAAGLAKSGVLRYAGSREALLLRVMYHEHLAWLDAIAQQLAEAPADELAEVLARTLAQRPVLCDLICTAPALICRLTPSDEHAVRDEAADITRRLGRTLRPRLVLDDNELALLTAAVHAFAGTAWGWADPGSAGGTAFVSDFEETFAALLRTFIAGLGRG